jgi:hypothetical protein
VVPEGPIRLLRGGEGGYRRARASGACRLVMSPAFSDRRIPGRGASFPLMVIVVTMRG